VLYPPHILARRFPAQSVPNTVEIVPKFPVSCEILSPPPAKPAVALPTESRRPQIHTTYNNPTPANVEEPDYRFCTHWSKPLPKPPVPPKPKRKSPILPAPAASESPFFSQKELTGLLPVHKRPTRRQHESALAWSYACASRSCSPPDVKPSTFVPPKDFVPRPSAQALRDAAVDARVNRRWRKKVSSRRTPGF
jgi:hypothetical protein